MTISDKLGFFKAHARIKFSYSYMNVNKHFV